MFDTSPTKSSYKAISASFVSTLADLCVKPNGKHVGYQEISRNP
jgi:hypothetical protein